ncbi:Bmptp-Z and Bmap-A fusion protein gamma [Operophtera brumata]|uniref:protein-tyrosine-phosphatase n=1 Tax=Operophtera brumata TaxID=104452 RepID=A0A0L7L8F6_OPEBR|nr:Bmptp-Z and Bmap-A fusion protein gamma [Operophtera brumata]
MESKRVEEEYQSFIAGNLWPLVYQRIGHRCQSYPYTCIEAKKTENKPLNRYRDVNPYDHSRIIIRKEDFRMFCENRDF